MNPRFTRKSRSRAGIVYEKIVRDEVEAPSTRMMYEARPPYDRLQEMLELPVDKGLLHVKRDGDRTYYVLVERGFDALRELEKAKKLLEGLGIRFDSKQR